jgi:hypothetical protein
MAEAHGAAGHAAAGTVKLPGFGNVSKKALGIGAVVAGGVLAYVYFRKARGGGSAASTTTAAGTGTDPNLDPATGFDYGTPEDLAALQGSQGLDPFALDSGLGLGGSGIGGAGSGLFYDPDTGQFDLSSPFTGGATTTTAPVTTNAEWEQAAIADLEAGGVAQATVSAAESGLPRYLAHLTLSGAQASAVQMAVGLAGPPPSGGPFSIRRAPAPAPKPVSGKVKVPDVIGLQYAGAAKIITAAGLKPHQTGPGNIVQQRPAAETTVGKGSTVVLFGANK